MTTFETVEAAHDAMLCKTSSAWKDAALDAIYRVAKRQRTVHVDDVLTEFSEPPESSKRVWGAIWRRAVAAGYIVPSGGTRRSQLPDEMNNGQRGALNYRVYNSLVYQAAA